MHTGKLQDDPVFPDAVLEALAQDTQRLSGTGDVAAAVLQGLEEDLVLIIVQQALEGGGGKVDGRGSAGGGGDRSRGAVFQQVGDVNL